ncbi:MAG: aminotransferase class V-fold PLP-dependent enzyme [Patescibacteria group bacterium]
MKCHFFNDYSEGAHPRILEALQRCNDSQETGYGEDSFSLQAALILKSKMGTADVDVHFLSAGTQANFIAMAAMLRPYESVIAADSGHIAVHEAGAVESTGHKINTIAVAQGKLTPKDIQGVVDSHTDEHMVKPRVVFISQATEVGTIYAKAELEVISNVCKKNDLYLYVDGARLGSALMSERSDVTISDIAQFADMFYIGGTKNGALLGEAMVIVNPVLKKDFRYFLKQRGALLAKGRVLGVQFVELFIDDLYFDLAKHANAMAKKLSDGIVALGHSFLADSSTNQIFPILPNALIEKMKVDYGFYVWGKIDADHSSIRLVASWATKESAVDEFLTDLRTRS